MAENSSISWCKHTWNPWRGCARVSPGCAHCYAEAMSHRNPAVLGTWGPDGTRPIAAESSWRTVYRWDRAARDARERHRVFCGSLMDVWENRPDLLTPRRRLLWTAYECRHLDFLFLTKRPQNIRPLLHAATHMHHPHNDWLDLQTRATRPNWWLGATVEDRTRLRERYPLLRDVPAVVRFFSCEPLLEDISDILADHLEGIHWVIVGGESSQGGATARPFDIEWVEGIITVCASRNVPVFVKQLGSRPVAAGLGLRLRGHHGSDENEWPDWMRVRQFPTVTF